MLAYVVYLSYELNLSYGQAVDRIAGYIAHYYTRTLLHILSYLQ